MIFLMLLADDAQRAYFQRLYDAFEPSMFGVALSILRSRDAAEEAVQESWVRVALYFEKIHAIPWDTIEGYLVILVRNVCMDQLRKARSAQTEELPEEWTPPEPAERAGTLLRRLVELIRAMPPAYREILEMKFVLEYTNREIGRALGVNESTVATRVARGRAMLADALRKEGYGEDGTDGL